MARCDSSAREASGSLPLARAARAIDSAVFIWRAVWKRRVLSLTSAFSTTSTSTRGTSGVHCRMPTGSLCTTWKRTPGVESASKGLWFERTS
jgi:hypothetical protein